MFNVEFWSFTKAPNSTAQPTGTSAVYKCVSNADFNIIEPRIPLQLGAASNPTAFNYAKITVFNRYYWVTRWAFEGGLWVAYMRVDALASWKTGIGNMSAYVLRAAADYNENIIDTCWPREAVYANSQQTLTNYPPYSTNIQDGTFVVGIAGTGASMYVKFNYMSFNLFMNALITDTFYSAVLTKMGLAANPELKFQVNPLQYITSCIWLPFVDVDTTAPTVSRLYIAGVDIMSLSFPTEGGGSITLSAWPISPIPIKEWITNGVLNRHPQTATHGMYVNASASEYSLNMPPFGKIDLDPSFCASHDQLYIKTTVDYRSGNAVLSILGCASGSGGAPTGPFELHSRITGNVGINIPVSITQSGGLGISSVLAPITSTISGAAAGLAAGGAIGAVAGGLAGLAGSVPGFIGDVAQSRINRASVIGGQPSIANFGTGPLPVLYYTWYTIGDMDVSDKGRPLCEIRQLSTLSGYQLCADVEVEIPCTRDEEQMIKGFLESGYFYE